MVDAFYMTTFLQLGVYAIQVKGTINACGSARLEKNEMNKTNLMFSVRNDLLWLISFAISLHYYYDKQNVSSLLSPSSS